MGYDMRGHGASRVTENEFDFDINTLAFDAVKILCALYPEGISMPSIILAGHRCVGEWGSG